MKKLVFAALGVIALMSVVTALLTAWFCVGGTKAQDLLLPDCAELCLLPAEIADEDNAFSLFC